MSAEIQAFWTPSGPDDLEVAVPKMPVMKKADVLEFARSGRMKFSRYETSDVRVRVYGDAADPKNLEAREAEFEKHGLTLLGGPLSKEEIDDTV